MSASSDTPSSFGDWESVRQCWNSSNEKQENERLRQEVRRMREEMKRREEETKKTNEEKDRMIELLMSRIDGTEKEFYASFEEWMKEEMEQMRLSSVQLSDQTLIMYKAIMKKGLTRSQCKSVLERKELAKEIERLEDICVNISKDVRKVNEHGIDQIKKQLAATKGIEETQRIALLSIHTEIKPKAEPKDVESSNGDTCDTIDLRPSNNLDSNHPNSYSTTHEAAVNILQYLYVTMRHTEMYQFFHRYPVCDKQHISDRYYELYGFRFQY